MVREARRTRCAILKVVDAAAPFCAGLALWQCCSLWLGHVQMRAKVVDALNCQRRQHRRCSSAPVGRVGRRPSRQRPQQRLRNAELSRHYYFW
jgi:hypothetical protein